MEATHTFGYTFTFQREASSGQKIWAMRQNDRLIGLALQGEIERAPIDFEPNAAFDEKDFRLIELILEVFGRTLEQGPPASAYQVDIKAAPSAPK